MDILKIKDYIFKKAKELEFKEFEIFYYFNKNTSVSVFKQELENFKDNSTIGLSFRGNFNNVTGFSYTENLSIESIYKMLLLAKENAKIGKEKDEFFSGSDKYPKIKTFYEDLEKVEVEQMLRKCLLIEKDIINYSEFIKSCSHCSISKISTKTVIINNKGLFLENKSNSIFASVGVVAKRDKLTKSDFLTIIENDFNKIDNKTISKEVSNKAISYLGAKSINSNRYKTIILNECFANLLEVFIPNFYAENVRKGFSLLKGKLGSNVASNKITILDNPLLENGYSSTPFDSEGVASFKKSVINQGILETYLYDLKSAKLENKKSTGNGFRIGYKSSLSTLFTNFYVKNGKVPFDSLIKEVKEGILITKISGLHSGANSISGDFSLLAEGFLINNGKIGEPIEQITISDNFYNVLKNISIVSDDLKFNTSSVGSPTVYVGEISVAGK